MELFTHVLLAVLCGYSMAVLLVELKRKWPIRRTHLRLRKILAKIHPRMPRMLSCTVCTSFWTTLIAEILLSIGPLLKRECPFFTWPVSGFIATGLTWTIMDVLRSLGVISDKLWINSESKDEN